MTHPNRPAVARAPRPAHRLSGEFLIALFVTLAFGYFLARVAPLLWADLVGFVMRGRS